MELRLWAREFLRHKDVFAKKIVEIKDTPDGLEVVYKAGTERCICNKELDCSAAAENTKIFVLNTRKNLDTLIHNWHSLAQMPGLVIYFVNPGSMQEKKWIIQPYLHDKVADDDTLKEGLISMFETVDEVQR